MSGSMPRLGDLIDDHCPRCRMLLNHAIASMMDGKVVKVICQTCLTEHPFLHEDSTKRKKPPGGRETLFDQVLAHGAASMETEIAPVRKNESQKKKKTPASARVTHKNKEKPTQAKAK
jgi:hypothetical protein